MAVGYVEVLQRVSLMTEGPCLCGDDWDFQRDNTAVHNGRPNKDLFPGEQRRSFGLYYVFP